MAQFITRWAAIAAHAASSMNETVAKMAQSGKAQSYDHCEYLTLAEQCEKYHTYLRYITWFNQDLSTIRWDDAIVLLKDGLDSDIRVAALNPNATKTYKQVLIAMRRDLDMPMLVKA